MRRNGDWLRVITIIVSILVPLLSGMYYIISQQHELDKKIALMQGRLEWNGLWLPKPKIETTADVQAIVRHLRQAMLIEGDST